ncbi:MAG: hypothetical protein HYR94_29340, partial [Chloroflexi bacterium]|nr:hypothetical protein [Chloroflexota bacterium]
MDSFTADYLASLVADLTIRFSEVTSRSLREKLSGSEQQQALTCCLQAGLVALLATASAQSPTRMDLLADIFQAFFSDRDVIMELVKLLRGDPLDIEELNLLFADAGYVAETLPGLNFAQGMAVYEAAFLAAAAEEPALQDIIRAGNLLNQTRLQREMLAAMRQLVDFLRQTQPRSVGVQPGQIIAHNLANEIQIYHLAPLELAAPASGWEEHYLKEAIRRQRLPDPALAKGREEERLPIPAIEAVAAVNRLVILGQPGGGKSTLVNHIATQLARHRLGQAGTAEKLPGWPVEERLLPVRIVLRHLAARLPAGAPRGTAGMVWDYLQHQLKQWGCEDGFNPLRRALREEGGVIFFDGLDEVREEDAEAKRTLIKEAIADFAAPLDKCRVVVTCREYAYNPPRQRQAGPAYTWRLPEADFPVVELALFDINQIEAFTQTWYRVTGPYKGWAEAKCRAEAANLSQAIKDWPHLRELGQYPLLLTLMAQVHGRDGYL